jgi:ribosomal-protein-alanine N-acetyltransferase
MERMREPGQAAFLVRATDGLVGVVNMTNIVMGGFWSGYLGFYAFLGHGGRGLQTATRRQVRQTGPHGDQLVRINSARRRTRQAREKR